MTLSPTLTLAVPLQRNTRLFLFPLILLSLCLWHWHICFIYERALRLPTSFLISGLVWLGVKPRLWRSPWRAFESTHPFMLSSTSLRETLLACSPFSSWNLSYFTVESTLSFSCSRSDPPLSPRCGPRPPWLSLPSWSGTLDRRLCSFSSSKKRLRLTCLLLSLCHRGHSFLFSRPSMFKFFRWSLRHSARSLLVSAAPTSLPLLFSSPSIWLSYCPLLHLSFYLKLSGRSGRNCLVSPPVLSGYIGSPDSCFLPGNNAADELARRAALLAPSAIPCSLSRLISRIHSRLFSDWRRTVSSKFFDTQIPSISTEELVLSRHDCCVLSRLRCNGHSLLLSSYLSRIGRIENPSCGASGHSSQDTSHLILHCPATDSLRRLPFGVSLSLYDLWSRPWGVAWLLGLHGLPSCPHSSEGVGYQQ